LYLLRLRCLRLRLLPLLQRQLLLEISQLFRKRKVTEPVRGGGLVIAGGQNDTGLGV